ncbi:MAG: Amuc_1100 family pilus-like protein [bacterium]
MRERKFVVAIIAGVVLLLCLAGFASAYRAYAKASTVKATLKGSYSQLQAIYNENPFPCLTNMTVLRGDTDWMNNWHQSLTMELRAIATPSTNPSSSIFIAKLQESSEELHKLARVDGSKMLPDGFAFGFERYLPRGYPAPEHVRRLSLQFSMVEAIVREILGSRVTELSQVDRERFEVESAEASSAGRRRGVAPAAVVAPPTDTDSGYSRQHFTIAFTSDEKALAEVLNRLAKMPLFVVVTEIKIDRVERGLRPRAEKATGEADKSAPPPPPTQRLVSGPGIAPLLKTRMLIDVYTFEGV